MNCSLRLTSITYFSPSAAPIHRSAWKKNSTKFTVARSTARVQISRKRCVVARDHGAKPLGAGHIRG
jgi:hypothetical protein